MGKCLFLTHAHIKEQFPHTALDDAHILNWLNAVESEYELIVYLDKNRRVDPQGHSSSRPACDRGVRGGPASLNPVEQLGFAVHPASRRRLVRIHDRRVPFTTGTSEWLRARDVAMHHHIALEDNEDLKSLFRFLTGKAVGFVAGGGGGFVPPTSVSTRLFRKEARNSTSWAARASGPRCCGCRCLASPEDLDQVIDDIFVASRGFKRRTFPRYSLLDHVAFDAALERQCRGAHVEDAWVPYFAVATDVDRAGQGPFVMRTGPLWKAVGASPPFRRSCRRCSRTTAGCWSTGASSTISPSVP